MQEFTINGQLITEPISTSELEAGTVCLINKDSQYQRVTIQHIDQDGDWHVEGDYTGKISKLRDLLRISILTKEQTYPIALKEWKKIIKQKLLGENVKAKLKPYRFKTGTNIQTCTECTSSFVAAKSQPFCEQCCQEMSTALLAQKRRPIPRKQFRPRGVDPEEAYKAGQASMQCGCYEPADCTSYEEWRAQQEQNAININKD